MHYFWKRVKAENLGFKRENRVAKILKRSKIRNQIEYDFVIDVLVPYEQEGLISKSEVDELKGMVADFERKVKSGS